MKTLARPSFFRTFDLLLSRGNPGLKRTRWSFDGVDFERERHSFTSARHSIVIDIATAERKGRRGWSLMVTKEYWWGPDDKPFKTVRWAKPLGGQRGDLMGWLRSKEAEMDRALAAEFGHDLGSPHADDKRETSATWEHGESEEEPTG
jgi:hypothetical protein